MDAVIIASAIAAAVLAVPLAVIVYGIHRQERVGLNSRNAGLCAALARKLLGLSGSLPPPTGPTTAPRGHQRAADPARQASRRTALATGAWS